ncbi:MAG: helix-turn-helix domain-containing protein [Pseudomonas balearica]|jgi:hypothetical protein|uniref:helix-turn-helix domain-containing protein n=1 Tax=Stutzerimonas balearica TaxID=74829 RepID=UPI0019A66628|nr:helix-turn-helix domain-containing protein [Stutzerimonas balearica]MBC7201546.1 helix-turn-helix domain-containing protein [Stutzerimonas balearica]
MDKDSLEAVLARMMGFLKVSTDSALARALPVNRQTLAGWRKRNSVPYVECIKFSNKHGIALDWLLTGAGPMLRDQSAQTPFAAGEPANPREQAILELYRALDEDAQREIHSAAEEKKRLKVLEQRIQELEAVVADIKRLA